MRLVQSATVAMLCLGVMSDAARAQASPPETLFVDVRVFDGKSRGLSAPTNVLVRGSVIAAIGAGPATSHPAATIVRGGGRTLMPGLIDNHTHMAMAEVSEVTALTADVGYLLVAPSRAPRTC